jgi:PAS domain-containing protein
MENAIMRAVAQHPVEIILLKQWASYISLPVFVMDVEGTLVFYNEPAEDILGRRFDDAGEIHLSGLSAIFRITALDGSAIPPEKIPIGIALLEHRPAHARVKFLGLDGVNRTIDVTALPIEGQARRHVGAVAMFWEPDL